jgi:hypothetical protein
MWGEFAPSFFLVPVSVPFCTSRDPCRLSSSDRLSSASAVAGTGPHTASPRSTVLCCTRYKAPNARVVGEFQIICKEVVVTYYVVLAGHFPGNTRGVPNIPRYPGQDLNPRCSNYIEGECYICQCLTSVTLLLMFVSQWSWHILFFWSCSSSLYFQSSSELTTQTSLRGRDWQRKSAFLKRGFRWVTNCIDFFCNRILFAICTRTFSKLCKNMYTVACRRVLSSAPL